MSLLKVNLEKLYQKKFEAEDTFPFENTFESLNSFINSEILSGHQFINPYRFASSSGMELSKALVLLMFIGSSKDNRIITVKYKYTCSNLNDSFLTEEQLDDFQCDEDCNCDDEVDLRGALENNEIDLNVYFEIDSQLKDYVINLFKSKTRESFNNDFEREVDSSINLQASFDLINESNKHLVEAHLRLVSPESALSQKKQEMVQKMKKRNKESK